MRPARAVLSGLSALLALAAISLSVRRPADPPTLAAAGEPVRIELRRPREDLLLNVGSDGSWYVAREADLADGEAVTQLLAGLRALKFGPSLTAETALASGLGPADSTRLRVLDASGLALFDGYFGRRAFGRSAFFRARDGEAVRLASGLDPELLRLPSAQWRQPRLLPGGCPTGIEVADRGAWRRVADDAARGLCALRVSSWAAEEVGDTETFARPLLKVRTLEGKVFTVGGRRGVERLARVDGRAALLRIHADAIEAAAADLVNSKP
jgi:hypothetical protein